MLKKGLIAIVSLFLISAFVACNKQDEQSSVSESVSEATEKQMQPVNDEGEAEAKKSESEMDENKSDANENGSVEEDASEAVDKAKEKVDEKVKELEEDVMPSSDASKIPSINKDEL